MCNWHIRWDRRAVLQGRNILLIRHMLPALNLSALRRVYSGRHLLSTPPATVYARSCFHVAGASARRACLGQTATPALHGHPMPPRIYYTSATHMTEAHAFVFRVNYTRYWRSQRN